VTTKKNLLVVAMGLRPDSGSEPGKGFNWSLVLSKFYHVHVFCWPKNIELCKASGLCNEWTFHPVEPDYEAAGKKAMGWYWNYARWCRALIPQCREVISAVQPVGLHHISLGSFRVLPRYDLLGIPYTLGPLGGGETIPFNILCRAGFPPKNLLLESLRKPINHSIRLMPHLRRVFAGAKLVLATTSETEYLLSRAGAKKTQIIFPDVVEVGIDPDEVRRIRSEQSKKLGECFRCVWSARFLWWKGGQLALRFLERLRQAGVSTRLDIYSDGAGIGKLKSLAAKQNLATLVVFHGLVPRPVLLEAYQSSHLFVYPSMHDSSSSAIPEAYSTGLPTMTLGLGGVGTAASPEAGLNRQIDNLDEWFGAGVSTVKSWIEKPELWLKASDAALARSREYDLAGLTIKVERSLVKEFDSFH
jgi:glycosyltransferase involved in cell wall biosynthesis